MGLAKGCVTRTVRSRLAHRFTTLPLGLRTKSIFSGHESSVSGAECPGEPAIKAAVHLFRNCDIGTIHVPLYSRKGYYWNKQCASLPGEPGLDGFPDYPHDPACQPFRLACSR